MISKRRSTSGVLVSPLGVTLRKLRYASNCVCKSRANPAIKTQQVERPQMRGVNKWSPNLHMRGLGSIAVLAYPEASHISKIHYSEDTRGQVEEIDIAHHNVERDLLRSAPLRCF